MLFNDHVKQLNSHYTIPHPKQKVADLAQNSSNFVPGLLLLI